jgi:septum site-determining protein MinC
MNKNKVILKGRKGKLVVQLDPTVDFALLQQCLVEKLQEAETFLGDARTAIEFTERILTEEEENSLLDLIKKHSRIQISYLFSNESLEIENPEVHHTPFMKLLSEEGMTKFHKGTLRSGHRLDYAGNVVILGDVNPGALVNAKGNILVLGYLNGTAYAGQENDSEAFIGALSLNPIQIKIGHTIAANPSCASLDTNKIRKTSSLEIAYSKDGRIIIEAFDKSTLAKMKKISN